MPFPLNTIIQFLFPVLLLWLLPLRLQVFQSMVYYVVVKLKQYNATFVIGFLLFLCTIKLQIMFGESP